MGVDEDHHAASCGSGTGLVACGLEVQWRAVRSRRLDVQANERFQIEDVQWSEVAANAGRVQFTSRRVLAALLT